MSGDYSWHLDGTCFCLSKTKFSHRPLNPWHLHRRDRLLFQLLGITSSLLLSLEHLKELLGIQSRPYLLECTNVHKL